MKKISITLTLYMVFHFTVTSQVTERWNLVAESWRDHSNNIYEPCKISYANKSIITTDTIYHIKSKKLKLIIELSGLRNPISFQYLINPQNFKESDGTLRPSYLSKIITGQKSRERHLSRNPRVIEALIEKKYDLIKLSKID